MSNAAEVVVTFVARYDELPDMESLRAVCDMIKGYGTLVSATMTGVPPVLDMTKQLA